MADSINLALRSTKQSVGAPLPNGRFIFTLINQSTGEIDTGFNDGGGNVTFPSLALDTPGTYQYTVREASVSGDGWITDSRDYSIAVTVTQNPDGSLSRIISYSQGYPVFKNTYVQPDTGLVEFPEIPVTAPGTYTYYVRETTPSGGGWTTDSREYPVVVTAKDDGDGNLILTNVEYPQGFPAFTDVYNATSAAVSITAYKSLQDWNGGEIPFDFALVDADTGSVAATGTNVGGVIQFPAQVYDRAGTHHYFIRETTPSGGGWTTDTSEYPVDVTVTDDGFGQLTASASYPGGDPLFHNIYQAGPGEISISGFKTAQGASLSEGAFSFGVFNQNGVLVAIAANDGAGNIRFPPLPFYTVGSYSYTVRELTPSGNGWTSDSTEYPVHITVTGNGAGQLLASADYPQGTPVFNDVYNAVSGGTVITAFKEELGWEGAEVPFEFQLVDDDTGTVIDTASNQNGVIVFAQQFYTEPGVHHYSIREISASGGGWSVDQSIYHVTVTVTDNIQGDLESQIDYLDGPPSFINRYQPSAADVTLSGSKTASGGSFGEGQFTFGIFNSSGAMISSGFNQTDGSISFSFPEFTKPGTYEYLAKEITSSGNGWITDTREFPILVTIADNGQGSLVSNVSYPEGLPSFANTYAANPVALSITAYKEEIGWNGPEVPFEFQLADDDTGAVVDTASNAGGIIAFMRQVYTQPGVYHYSIREISGSGNGWTVDSRIYHVTVTVTDNGQGQLEATADYPEGAPEFRNQYQAAPVVIHIEGVKTATGSSLLEGQFTFGIFDLNGDLAADASNGADGRISFTLPPFTKPGTYEYTAREVTPSGNGWTVDSRIYRVTVTVTDNGQGQLTGFVDYVDGTPSFVNSYSSGPISLQLAAQKNGTGAALQEGQFTFGVFDQNGIQVASAVNGAPQ